MRKNIALKLFLFLFISFLLNSFGGCNNSISAAKEIVGMEVTENTEYTGRGNQNEVLITVKINVKENEPVSLKNIVLVKNATTHPTDVKEIKIYSTGSLDTLVSIVFPPSLQRKTVHSLPLLTNEKTISRICRRI